MSEIEPVLDSSLPHFLARLEEFFAQRTSWHRRLWTVGTVLGLKEVAEYADSCLDGSVPNTEGLRFVIDTSRREVGRDPGVRHLAGELDLVLDRLRVDSPRSVPRDANDELRQLIRRAEDEYCSAWERASGDVPLEFRSRAMASHLLDSGFSEFHLHRWLRAVRQGVQTMADLNRAVSEMFASMPMQRSAVQQDRVIGWDRSLAEWLRGKFLARRARPEA